MTETTQNRTTNKYESPTILIAQRLALIAHRNQLYAGKSYYTKHVCAVVNKLLELYPRADEDVCAAAYLHDVLEDSSITTADLLFFGITPRAVNLVETLTRYWVSENETYAEYINNVHGTEAQPIKIADLEVNLSNNPPEHLRRRYVTALTQLRRNPECP